MDRLNLVDFVRSDKCFDKLNDAKGQLKIVIRCNKLINWRGVVVLFLENPTPMKIIMKLKNLTNITSLDEHSV